jgi:CBS domain-containing protein
MLVEEVMTTNIIRIDSNKTVFDACKDYSRNKVGSLLVTDNNLTVGILTERDIIEKVILLNRNAKETKISEIMTANLKTIHALAPIEKAAKIMKENNIKKLPVVLNNEIIGIITETDLSRTIEVYSQAIEELTTFYQTSRENIEKIMDEWQNILLNLKNYKKINENKEIESLL